jgi:3-oxoacyl-[acyl-carrier protein] reductase
MGALKNKVAIITGGARDIGKECSVKLAEQGASVCINYMNSKTQAEELLNSITEFGGKAIIVQADVTVSEEVNNMMEKCKEAFGRHIHILVNNAGGLVARKTMQELDKEFWDKVIDLNLGSTFLVTKEVLPYMPEGSSIVNLSSQAARDGGGAGSIAYAASKGGILTFTKSLAKELGPKNIRVNCVSPGLINTTFHDTFTKPEVREKVAEMTPLRREGEASEVADLVAYLASDKSSFVTGASLEINGGLYLI